MYTANEYADMYLIYGECLCNALQASRVYGERYPNRQCPHPGVFLRLDHRLRSGGRLVPGGSEGRPQSLSNASVEDVLSHVEDDPTTSCRQLERETGVSKSTVNRILRTHSLHPYHYTPVQHLYPGDAELRVEFCQKFLRIHDSDPNFLTQILWTDESLFMKEGIYNRHNSHYYAEENPLLTRERSFQNRWKINMWGGIIGNYVYLFQLPDILNGELYAQLIETELPRILQTNFDPADWPQWFQHDGAPAHNTNRVRDLLNQQFPERWFGVRGPIRWPPRSPDLTPLDFFLWGYLKEKVYINNPETMEVAVQRLMEAVPTITAEMLTRVRADLLRRMHACIAAGGGHFEHIQ